MNVFVFTDHPTRAFERIKPLVSAGLTVAYREVSGDTFTVLFPPGQRDFKVR